MMVDILQLHSKVKDYRETGNETGNMYFKHMKKHENNTPVEKKSVY